MNYLNRECLDRLSAATFQAQPPYPWVNIADTLTPAGFARLRQALPDVSAFERKVGHRRAYGQGCHDRCMLHYREGMMLPQPWREFLAELRGDAYGSFLRRMFGLRPEKRVILTFEWYYAWQGCAVSPHCDARRKLGTHIFYFNTDADWDASWGGHVLILDDQQRFHRHSAPNFEDLHVAASLDPRGNGSLLFRRTAHSWHGVRPLKAPAEQHLRKLFLVTINEVTWQVVWRRVRGKDPDGYPLVPLVDHLAAA